MVRPASHRLPIPVGLIVRRRQIFLDLFQDQVFVLPAGFVLEIQHEWFAIHVADVVDLQLHMQGLLGPGDDRFPAVVRFEEMPRPLIDLLVDHIQHELPAIAAIEDALPVRIHLLALSIHDFVVLKQMLADVEVVLFDFLLRLLDAAGDHA